MKKKKTRSRASRVAPVFQSVLIAAVTYVLLVFLLLLGIAPEQHDIQVGLPAPLDILATKDVNDTVTTDKLRDEVVRLRMARHGALLEFEEVGVVKESDCLPELVVTEARRAQDTSDRDRQVAEMLRQGMSERKISQALHISHSTVNAIKRRVVGRSDRPHDEKKCARRCRRRDTARALTGQHQV